MEEAAVQVSFKSLQSFFFFFTGKVQTSDKSHWWADHLHLLVFLSVIFDTYTVTSLAAAFLKNKNQLKNPIPNQIKL